MARERIVINEFVAQVGARLRALRLELGWSLRKLGELSGCHFMGIMDIELGRTAMNVKTLRKLARVLGVQPLDLLNHNAEKCDLGWLVETMRHNPSVVRVVGAKVGLALRRKTKPRERVRSSAIGRFRMLRLDA
jgi:transcriptional regulator with XRE-family HTH domain